MNLVNLVFLCSLLHIFLTNNQKTNPTTPSLSKSSCWQLLLSKFGSLPSGHFLHTPKVPAKREGQAAQKSVLFTSTCFQAARVTCCQHPQKCLVTFFNKRCSKLIENRWEEQQPAKSWKSLWRLCGCPSSSCKIIHFIASKTLNAQTIHIQMHIPG